MNNQILHTTGMITGSAPLATSGCRTDTEARTHGAAGSAPRPGPGLERIPALDDLGAAMTVLDAEFGRFRRLLMHVVAADLAAGGTADRHVAMAAWAGPASVAMADMVATLGALNHGLAKQV